MSKTYKVHVPLVTSTTPGAMVSCYITVSIQSEVPLTNLEAATLATRQVQSVLFCAKLATSFMVAEPINLN